jgi:hypothetical protein
LNKIDIFTLCYFHSENNKSVIFIVKITKLIVTLCVFDYDVMLHVNALKHIRFETNMFQKQRKCNKQKIQCFVDEYGIYFTRETWFLWYFHSSFALVKILKILSHSWNKFHIHQKALNILFILGPLWNKL